MPPPRGLWPDRSGVFLLPSDSQYASLRLLHCVGSGNGDGTEARRAAASRGPLRAITDFDEASMEVRRGKAGDRDHALALLDAAHGSLESIGMPGWFRRADELRRELSG